MKRRDLEEMKFSSAHEASLGRSREEESFRARRMKRMSRRWFVDTL